MTISQTARRIDLQSILTVLRQRFFLIFPLVFLASTFGSTFCSTNSKELTLSLGEKGDKTGSLWFLFLKDSNKNSLNFNRKTAEKWKKKIQFPTILKPSLKQAVAKRIYFFQKPLIKVEQNVFEFIWQISLFLLQLLFSIIIKYTNDQHQSKTMSYFVNLKHCILHCIITKDLHCPRIVFNFLSYIVPTDFDGCPFEANYPPRGNPIKKISNKNN